MFARVLPSLSMNQSRPASSAMITIAAVERDCGLSKDTLRVWERRYGFPQPLRDVNGERVYPLDQVERLRLVKRLLDQGYRPGKIMGFDLPQLQSLADLAAAPVRLAAANDAGHDELEGLLALVRAHDVEPLRCQLRQILLRIGLARFVIDVVAPLATLVGEAWTRGELQIYEEHLFTESIQVVLRNAINTIPQPGERPRVLLTTFPNEPHGIGVLMAEAIFTLEGARCISLGVMTPLWDIVLAARAQQADMVALSFSSILSPAAVVDGLTELREKLPHATELWAGGSSAALRRRALRGVRALRTLDQIAPALAQWRHEHES